MTALIWSESSAATANSMFTASAMRVRTTTAKNVSLKRDDIWLGAVSLACPCIGLGSWRSTPEYTAQMGHWSEDLADDLAEDLVRRHGESPDRRLLVEILAEVGKEIDVLAGRSFRPLHRATATIYSGGLPLVEVPDMQVGPMETTAEVWAVPDPVNAQMATTLQVMPIDPPVRKASPPAEALVTAGCLIADASRAGLLEGGYVVRWLGAHTDGERRRDLFRRVMDPMFRFYVPVLGEMANGWWFQIARRLIWVTSETNGDGRLVELLLDGETTGGEAVPLVATEPVLIAAPMTRQPVEWAFTARIWAEGVQRPNDRPWSILAGAIHGHGIPTITLDSASTPEEIACQVVLKGYWHGYIDSDEPALARAVANAYTQPVARIQRQTHAPTRESAAAMLLEQLIRPGFDPAQGAEATRRYVRRKASIVVMEHRKREAPDRYPWTHVGISERRFYKLLPLFADKVNGRYDYDHDDVVTRMKVHLDKRDRKREIRAAALELLRERGFSEAAARKWLQRHEPEQAINAWPRGQRPVETV